MEKTTAPAFRNSRNRNRSKVSILENRATSTSLRRVFGVPIMVGLLSLSGLLAALLSEDLGRYFSWIAVGLPLIISLWFWLQQFRSTK